MHYRRGAFRQLSYPSGASGPQVSRFDRKRCSWHKPQYFTDLNCCEIKRHPLLMNHKRPHPLPTAVWMDLALLLPPFTTWVYIGLLRFHQPYNWAAHSCMAIHPCRLPPAGHGVQLVEFLAVPTWCVCCQIMERPEDFLKRKDEKGLFDRPTFHISG